MLLSIGVSTTLFAQPQAKTPPPGKLSAPAQKATPASLELQAAVRARDAARQSADPSGISNASRHVAAIALLELGKIKLAAGAAPESMDIFRRAVDLEDVPAAHTELAGAYLISGQLDEGMNQATNVLLTDPQNALAWRVQGQLWMMKKNYPRAVAALRQSSGLQSDPYTSYLLGTTLLYSREPEKARVTFGDLLQKTGSRASVHALLSDAYRDAGSIDDADRELKRALALDPRLGRAHYRLGLLAVTRAEWNTTSVARVEFAKEVQINPRGFFGNYALGLTEFFDHNYQQAEAYLASARDSEPQWPEPWLYLGLAASGKGNYKDAEQLLRKSIELSGSNESRGDYQIRRAYYTLGRLFKEQGRKEEAADCLRHLREIQTKLLLVDTANAVTGGMAQMGAMAAAFSSLPQLQAEELVRASAAGNAFPFVAVDGNRSAKQLQAARTRENELRKILAGALNDLGTVEARQEQFAMALTHFHAAEYWYSDTPSLMRNIGMAAARVEDYPECERALRPVVAANPQDTLARSMLGLALFTTNSFSEAVEVFTPLGDSALERPELAYSWAASLVRVNRYAEATALLDKLEARQLSPETLILVAQTWSQMSNYPRTVAACHKALEADSELLRAHYIAGLALIRQDRPAEAAQELRAELASDPADVDAQFHLAFVLLQQSQNDEAVRWLRSVLARNPDHPEANYELGKELLSAGKPSDAIPYLEAAARLRPTFEPVHYQLQSAYRAAGRKEDADREAKTYRELKAKSRNITLPPPREPDAQTTPRL